MRAPARPSVPRRRARSRAPDRPPSRPPRRARGPRAPAAGPASRRARPRAPRPRGRGQRGQVAQQRVTCWRSSSAVRNAWLRSSSRSETPRAPARRAPTDCAAGRPSGRRAVSSSASSSSRGLAPRRRGPARRAARASLAQWPRSWRAVACSSRSARCSAGNMVARLPLAAGVVFTFLEALSAGVVRNGSPRGKGAAFPPPRREHRRLRAPRGTAGLACRSPSSYGHRKSRGAVVVASCGSTSDRSARSRPRFEQRG